MKIPNMNLIAFDPGETTGIVEIINGVVVRSYSLKMVEIYTILASRNAVYRRWARYDAWVVEQFLLYPQKAKQQGYSEIPSARLIGALIVGSMGAGAVMTLQLACNTKQFVTESKLSLIKLKAKINNRHEKDALRHAVYYMLTKGRVH